MNTVKNGKGSKNRTKNKKQYDVNFGIINWLSDKKDKNGITQSNNSKKVISKSNR
jgi:hypothetical protein